MDFHSLKKAHYDLMKKYFDTLGIVSNLPQLPEFPLINKEYKTTLRKQITNFQDHHIEGLDYRLIGWTTTTRFFVSFFVEWHVRKKLNSLIEIYAQLEQSINPDDEEALNKINWLKESQEKMQKFSNTLSIFSSLNAFIKNSVMFFSGFLMAALGANSIYNAIILLFNLSIDPIFVLTIPLTILFLLYLFFFLESAFSYKRLIFHVTNSEKSDDTSVQISKNVYQLENDLYSLIGRKKPREFPINIAIESVFLIAIGVFGITSFIITNSLQTKIFAGLLVVMIILRIRRYYYRNSLTKYR
jgi:hypothetical protein